MILHRALTSRPLNATNEPFSLISELKAAIPRWESIVANCQQPGLRRSLWRVIDSLVPGLLLQALAFVLALPHVLFSGSYEPVSLAASISSPTGVVVRSNPLRFSGYHVQTSRDLVHWQDRGDPITLDQKNWPWARGRLTAATVVNLKHVPDLGKYVMFFHGSGPESEQVHFNNNASLGIAWSDDLQTWSWPGKTPE